MVDWEIKLTKKAIRDAQRLKGINLEKKAKAVLNSVRVDPFGDPPPYEKLTADLKGAYSRRINIRHRLVYTVDSSERVVVVCGMFSHYGD